ncbi:MAG: tRNA pseudouridine(38-40) synthase TruA [Clostridia bacterium]|nr:tRNA pseudouridine(38-40) synthase TruA [Clostridia bacterium]
MRKFLLTIKYNGAEFVGWQVQKNGLSVQTCLQDALETLLGHRPDVTGCSRTDSGVHALGYCAAFVSDTDKTCGRIVLSLNALLPDTVSVWDCMEVPMDFHPRYHAVGKEYIYRLYDGMAPDPFLKGLAWHYKGELDVEKMKAAARLFVGKHDFRSFMASGSNVLDTVRQIHWFTVDRKEGRLIEIRVCGDGFLYNMVRILVGTLVYVGKGRLAVEDMPVILAAKNRDAAGQTAPAEGLYLHKVFYDQKEMEG